MKRLISAAAALCLLPCLAASPYSGVTAATQIQIQSEASAQEGQSAAFAEKLQIIEAGACGLYADRYGAPTGQDLSVGSRLNTHQTYYVGTTAGIAWNGMQCYIYSQGVYSQFFDALPLNGTSQSSRARTVLSAVDTVSAEMLADAHVMPGAYFRTTANTDYSFNGSNGHSLIILGYDAECITLLEGNADGGGLIRKATLTYEQFNRQYMTGCGRRVCHIIQPDAEVYRELYGMEFRTLNAARKPADASLQTPVTTTAVQTTTAAPETTTAALRTTTAVPVTTVTVPAVTTTAHAVTTTARAVTTAAPAVTTTTAPAATTAALKTTAAPALTTASVLTTEYEAETELTTEAVPATTATPETTAAEIVSTAPVQTLAADDRPIRLPDVYTGETVRVTRSGYKVSLFLPSARSYTWKSSNPSVAEVDGAGLVTVRGNGEAIITAVQENVRYEFPVSVLITPWERLGDINLDGKVNTLDVRLALTVYVDKMVQSDDAVPLTDEQFRFADINEDGKIGLTDVRLILRYYVENIVAHSDLEPEEGWQEILQ